MCYVKGGGGVGLISAFTVNQHTRGGREERKGSEITHFTRLTSPIKPFNSVWVSLTSRGLYGRGGLEIMGGL